ncbi:MAG: RNA polymerase sigma factor [Fibrobacteria bacterium]|jgi:RNA polymerase sigma-70 factor (ECF subfamily)
MSQLTEPSKELLSECKAGNPVAFKEVFHMYRNYAYNLVYKITGPEGEHEDLVQEAFFQMYLSLKSFQGNSSFKTWFHRIIINTCTARWRFQEAGKRISSKKTTSLESMDYELPSRDEGIHKELELKNLVELALAQLDEKLRVPLVLNIYSDMDLSEISVALDIPEGTVKSRLFTARQKIKEYLDTLE